MVVPHYGRACPLILDELYLFILQEIDYFKMKAQNHLMDIDHTIFNLRYGIYAFDFFSETDAWV